jgi:hypothetical protein
MVSYRDLRASWRAAEVVHCRSGFSVAASSTVPSRFRPNPKVTESGSGRTAVVADEAGMQACLGTKSSKPAPLMNFFVRL